MPWLCESKAEKDRFCIVFKALLLVAGTAFTSVRERCVAGFAFPFLSVFFFFPFSSKLFSLRFVSTSHGNVLFFFFFQLIRLPFKPAHC